MHINDADIVISLRGSNSPEAGVITSRPPMLRAGLGDLIRKLYSLNTPLRDHVNGSTDPSVYYTWVRSGMGATLGPYLRQMAQAYGIGSTMLPFAGGWDLIALATPERIADVKARAAAAQRVSNQRSGGRRTQTPQPPNDLFIPRGGSGIPMSQYRSGRISGDTPFALVREEMHAARQGEGELGTSHGGVLAAHPSDIRHAIRRWVHEQRVSGDGRLNNELAEICVTHPEYRDEIQQAVANTNERLYYRNAAFRGRYDHAHHGDTQQDPEAGGVPHDSRWSGQTVDGQVNISGVPHASRWQGQTVDGQVNISGLFGGLYGTKESPFWLIRARMHAARHRGAVRVGGVYDGELDGGAAYSGGVPHDSRWSGQTVDGQVNISGMDYSGGPAANLRAAVAYLSGIVGVAMYPDGRGYAGTFRGTVTLTIQQAVRDVRSLYRVESGISADATGTSHTVWVRPTGMAVSGVPHDSRWQGQVVDGQVNISGVPHDSRWSGQTVDGQVNISGVDAETAGFKDWWKKVKSSFKKKKDPAEEPDEAGRFADPEKAYTRAGRAAHEMTQWAHRNRITSDALQPREPRGNESGYQGVILNLTSTNDELEAQRQAHQIAFIHRVAANVIKIPGSNSHKGILFTDNQSAATERLEDTESARDIARRVDFPSTGRIGFGRRDHHWRNPEEGLFRDTPDLSGRIEGGTPFALTRARIVGQKGYIGRGGVHPFGLAVTNAGAFGASPGGASMPFAFDRGTDHAVSLPFAYTIQQDDE